MVFVLRAFRLTAGFGVVLGFAVSIFLTVLQNFFLFRLDRISLSVTSSSSVYSSVSSSDSVT